MLYVVEDMATGRVMDGWVVGWMDVDHGRRRIVGVSLGHVERWAISIDRVLAGGHIEGVGKVYRHYLPLGVGHHEGEGTRDVMHGAHASGVGFDVFGPSL